MRSIGSFRPIRPVEQTRKGEPMPGELSDGAHLLGVGHALLARGCVGVAAIGDEACDLVAAFARIFFAEVNGCGADIVEVKTPAAGQG